MSFTTQFHPFLPRTVSTNLFSAAPKFGIDGCEDIWLLEPFPVEASKPVSPKPTGMPTGDTFTLTRSTPAQPKTEPSATTPTTRGLGKKVSRRRLLERNQRAAAMRPKRLQQAERLGPLRGPLALRTQRDHFLATL
jgi:hypothetical protein